MERITWAEKIAQGDKSLLDFLGGTDAEYIPELANKTCPPHSLPHYMTKVVEGEPCHIHLTAIGRHHHNKYCQKSDCQNYAMMQAYEAVLVSENATITSCEELRHYVKLFIDRHLKN